MSDRSDGKAWIGWTFSQGIRAQVRQVGSSGWMGQVGHPTAH